MCTRSGTFDYTALEAVCPDGFVKVSEGTTAVLFPPAMVSKQHQQLEQEAQEDAVDDQAVFYNPAQVVNRDLSISALEWFSRLRLTEPPRRGGTKEGITILEALSATGLRAIRYYKEITNVRYIIANDLDADAVACIERNCAFNGVPIAHATLTENFPTSAVTIAEDGSGIAAGGAIVANKDDAIDLMHRLGMNAGVHQGQRLCFADATSGKTTPLLQSELMDVVDLDPYGTASPFLDGAFTCIKEGGLMLVTSTDSAILCGNYPDTCHAKYNSVPYKGSHCHEMAVRILLASIERVANKHKKFIVPVISLHIDFYVRCFFRVYTQPAEVKLSPCKLGMQYQCTHCPAFWVRPMAVAKTARHRRRKQQQQQRNGSAGGDGRRPGHGPEHNVAGAKRDRSPAREDEPNTGEASCATAGPRKECMPVLPSRQETPRVQAPTVRESVPVFVPSSHASPSLTDVSPAPSCGCPVCGSEVTLSGPLYIAPTQHREYLEGIQGIIDERDGEERLTATARITGLVQVAREELPDCPLFYLLPDIASYVRVRCPPTPYFVAALARLGYRCSQVHCAPAGIKTDCPPDVLVRVMLRWKMLEDEKDAKQLQAQQQQQQEGVTPSSVAETVAASTSPTRTDMAEGKEGFVHKKAKKNSEPVRLLVTPLTEGVDFTYDKKYDFRSQAAGVAKFVPNAPGWGPKRRHQGAAHEANDV